MTNVELNTYNAWKSKGYQVKKGEKSIHQIAIWKNKSLQQVNENGEKENKNKMIRANSYFFTSSQVERIGA